MALLLKSPAKRFLIGAANDEERVPLHIASVHNRVSLVTLLLEARGDLITSKDEKGQTALHLASTYVRKDDNK